MWSARNGFDDVVSLLLEKEADIHIIDNVRQCLHLWQSTTATLTVCAIWVGWHRYDEKAGRYSSWHVIDFNHPLTPLFVTCCRTWRSAMILEISTCYIAGSHVSTFTYYCSLRIIMLLSLCLFVCPSICLLVYLSVCFCVCSLLRLC